MSQRFKTIKHILYFYIDNKQKDFIIKIGDFGSVTDLSTTKKDATDCGTNKFKAPKVETEFLIINVICIV